MLNFIFTKESLVIEKFDQKYCFKAVQKLAKRESCELLSEQTNQIIKAKRNEQADLVKKQASQLANQ